MARLEGRADSEDEEAVFGNAALEEEAEEAIGAKEVSGLETEPGFNDATGVQLAGSTLLEDDNRSLDWHSMDEDFSVDFDDVSSTIGVAI